MTRNELLSRAAEVLRERGFTKHVLVNDTGEGLGPVGAVCLVGALNVVDHGSPRHAAFGAHGDRVIFTAAEEALSACAVERGVKDDGRWAGPVAPAINYNNAPETTLEDVLSLIECAKARE